MEFVGYETCEKLIWKSGEGCTSKNKTSKQGIIKSNTNKTSPSSTLGFGCYPHKETCDILPEYFFELILKSCTSKNKGLY